MTTLLLGAVLSERAATEAELERTGASLAEAQAVARIGSWEWSIAPDTVTWSDELYRLFGLPPQSVPVTFESFLERVNAGDRERVRGIVERALGDGEPFAFDHRIDLPDGDARWLHARGRVIADERGIRFVCSERLRTSPSRGVSTSCATTSSPPSRTSCARRSRPSAGSH